MTGRRAVSGAEISAAASSTVVLDVSSSRVGDHAPVPIADFADTVPGDVATTAVLAVGSSVTNTIETGTDQDWFRIELVAGQTYTFTVGAGAGTPLGDSVLTLYGATGTLITSNDDAVGYYSRITYTAAASGVFFLGVEGYGSADIGNYTLAASVAAPPVPLPVYSMDQVAAYLTDGYWNDTERTRHAFAGTTITYNIENLTAEGRTYAIEAFNTWAGVSGLTFTRVTSGGQITFDDNASGANASFTATNSVTQSSHVNVALSWLGDYDPGRNSYSFQTYIHEIGHSLGLGHAGNYNGSAGWSAISGGDNHFLNDSWQATVMSYFDQDENTSVNASRAIVIGPMIADIIAIQSLYGVPTNVRAGNTTYGFNNTSIAEHGFSQYTEGSMVAFAIFDSGGIDTLDASGFIGAQVISLAPGTYSNIGGEVGNVGIAVNAVIENALGGAGNDTITGNLAGNNLWGNGGADTINAGQGDDFLYGGAGADTLNGALGFDYADYMTAGAGVLADLSNSARNTGHAFGDTYNGIEGINGSNYTDELWGDAANNTINGRVGEDVIYGGLGADTLSGGVGNDTLLGGQGWDFLYGRDGNDTLNGAKGNDMLTGEAGNDTFIFTIGGMADTVTDFTAGEAIGDVLQLSLGAAFDTFAEVMAAATQIGGSVVINFGGGDSVTLLSTTLGGFATNDFAFV